MASITVKQAEEFLRRLRVLEAKMDDLHRVERAHKNYGCRTIRSTNQTVNDTEWTYINYLTDTWDPWAMHSTILNQSRVTPGAVGPYLVIGRGLFEANSTGVRLCHLRLNGTTIFGRSGPFPANGTYPTTVFAAQIYVFDADDYVEFGMWQNSTAARYATESELMLHLLT